MAIIAKNHEHMKFPFSLWIIITVSLYFQTFVIFRAPSETTCRLLMFNRQKKTGTKRAFYTRHKNHNTQKTFGVGEGGWRSHFYSTVLRNLKWKTFLKTLTVQIISKTNNLDVLRYRGLFFLTPHNYHFLWPVRGGSDPRFLGGVGGGGELSRRSKCP